MSTHCNREIESDGSLCPNPHPCVVHSDTELPAPKKIILDLCGGTGSWSQPYREAGYDVRLITLPDFDIRRWREYPEVVEPVENGSVYGILAAPPCTKFSRAAWQIPKEKRGFKEGMECVRACLDLIWSVQEHGAPLKFWALENPDGYLTKFLGYPVFSFQPWQFGETDFRATKRTMLWGYFKDPSRTVRTRTIPTVSPYSRPAGDGIQDDMLINRKWAKATAEDRAKTSEHFAQAFFKANQ